ncbi:response regulator [Flavobacterium sp.]|uniref:response regulator n=1 Tax=Flavobacterium sp. TaxID=239 RepID=UPI0025C17993|nr:response regulator [Flavobacterium sp.]
MQTKPEFLIVDDNLIDQLVIKQLLKKVLDIDEVFIANNGKEGIQWLAAKKNSHPLIILLDIQMPIMNGFEFLEEFRKLKKDVKKGIRIFVLSSTLDLGEIAKINKNKYVNAFLNKPFPIEEFKALLFNY